MTGIGTDQGPLPESAETAVGTGGGFLRAGFGLGGRDGGARAYHGRAQHAFPPIMRDGKDVTATTVASWLSAS